LNGRVEGLKESLREMAEGYWNQLVVVDVGKKSLTVREHVLAKIEDASGQKMGFKEVVKVVQGLDAFQPLLVKLSREIAGVILRPRLVVDDNGQTAEVVIDADTLSCAGRVDGQGTIHLFEDLTKILDFLASSLPPSISLPLSDLLVPSLSAKLVEFWLESCVPLSIEEMPAFQQTLDAVQAFTAHIERLGWHGSRQLQDWVANAPRIWLTKRREAVLGDVRNLVFTGLGETKVVERVETQKVTRDDHQAIQASGGDAAADDDGWDAWDEPGEGKTEEAPAVADDEDASAWDTEDPAPAPAEEKAEPDPPSTEKQEDEGDDADAWGWGDDDNASNSQNPPSPIATKKPSAAANSTSANSTAAERPADQQRTLTLRETFTVTLIPDELLTILQDLISDAETLLGPAYASSPMAPAATALYALPTLALAIYRATAPTAYAKLPGGTGNMLIYNDSLRLADQLRAWQAETASSVGAAGRLRLDSDVQALEAFAKRAYASEMEAQRTILRDLLDGAQGFVNVTKQPFKQAAESAVQEVVGRLRDVRAQWLPILSQGALLQALGSLLSSVLSQVIREIEELGDIGEEDSHQLRRLMDVISTANEFFIQQQPSSTAGGSPSREGEAQQDMTFIYCPLWFKFQYLAEILESSLADIKYLWMESELSLEFDQEEVIELIEGLFADSDVRRKTIGEIRASRRGIGGRR
jgi:protein transport protein DSL1/ZW10